MTEFRGWKLKRAADVKLGDSVCSLGIVQRIERDVDGFLEFSFAEDGPLGTAAVTATGMWLQRPPRLAWHRGDPVFVLAD